MNPDKFINMLIIIDEDALLDILERMTAEGRTDLIRPIVFFNSEYKQPKDFLIPQEILTAADESDSSIAWTVCSPEEIKYFSVQTEKTEKFLKGEPILISMSLKALRAKRGRWGKKIDSIEKEIKSALAATTIAVIERLVLLRLPKGQPRYGQTEYLRDEIIKELVSHWLQLDYVDTLTNLNQDKCFARFGTLTRNGYRKNVWPNLYPSGSVTAYSKFWASQYQNHSQSDVKDEEAFQIRLLLSLFKLEFRALRRYEAEHQIAELARKGKPDSKTLRDQVAGTQDPDHVSVLEALYASFSGDFNPAVVCNNLNQSIDYFDTMRLIGRLYRGYEDVIFAPEHVVVLKSALRDLERWSHSPWPEKDRSSKEKAFWVQAMTRTMPLANWKSQFG